MASITQILGRVNPWLYAENGEALLKKYGYDKIPAEEVKPIIPAEHNLNYDSASEQLEPIYFFILDLVNDFGFKTEKLIDNFSSTPGSSHFSDLQGKATAMQQQATKTMADINTVLRSVLNIIYDLKEFKIRLQAYDDLNSDENKESAILVLKQIWMDKVDIQKGNTSIKAMALGQAGFQTLLNAFNIVKDEKDVDKLDLNEMVKRLLKPRIHEFRIWLKESETELRKRYAIEKSYLKSQVNSLKLYSRWAKPYLKAAKSLEMKEFGRDPALINVFNTLLLELTLFGKSKINLKAAIFEGNAPEDLKNLKEKRDYFSCVFFDFRFRGIPQRTGQQSQYVFGGRTEVKFMAYALNSDEIDKLHEELDKSDVEDVLSLIEGSTTESMGQMQKEIDYFLKEEDKKEGKPKSGSNPFLALIGTYNKSKKKEENKEDKKEEEPEKKEIKMRPDDWIEKTHMRNLALNSSKESVFKLFDAYKKAHGMESWT